MKAIDLKTFVEENEVEYHWHDEDVILMPYISHIQEFNDILGENIFDDDGVSCIMKDGYLCFHMREICDYFDIELTDIFKQ